MKSRFILSSAATLLAGAAHAANLDRSLTGTSLLISTPCAEHVEIVPDPSLHDQVNVAATAEHQEEIDHLVLESGQKANIRSWQGGCYRTENNAYRRTLALVAHVPVGFPIAIDEDGAGRYTIGPIGGTLHADISGAAELTAAQVTRLDTDISGNGNVDVGQANGPASIEISGHGRVSVDRANLPSLSAEMSGAGSLTIASGQIGSAKVDESGLGSVSIGATVGTASVEISGAGSVHFHSLTGKLEKDVSGLGSVSVGN